MRYLDTGSRNPADALGSWFQSEAPEAVQEIRIKSGYFGVNGLSPLAPILEELARARGLIRIVVGSNDCDTLADDIDLLCRLVGGPSATSQVAIASFTGGLFHSKAYHVLRRDGSQAAYVGSANLTTAGIGGLNIEAGVMTDTNVGDGDQLATSIAASVDAYFLEARPFVHQLTSTADIAALAAAGLLRTAPRPRRNAGQDPRPNGHQRPRLRSLIAMNPLVERRGTEDQGGEEARTTEETLTVDTEEPENTVETTTVTTAQAVLVAEIGGGPRWKQANFPIEVMRHFFQVDIGQHAVIELSSVQADGTVESAEQTQFVAVKSQNYRFELTSVMGIPYPTDGRPIGIFVRDARHEFRYRILLPGFNGHTEMAALLAREYDGPGHHLKRIATDLISVRAAWARAPF